MNARVRGAVESVRPSRKALLVAAVVLYLEFMVVGGYLIFTGARITNPLPAVVYPLVWVNAGAWAVAATTPAPAGRRRRRVAAALAAGYFLLLGAVGGVFTPGHLFHGHAHGASLEVQLFAHPPGWNPAVFYGGPLLSASLIPYKVVGYAALAYLVYATLLDAAGSAMAGVVGVFSCVSCTWPVLGAVLTGAFGSSSAVVAFASGQPIGASTLVYLSAVGLLAYRPAAGR